MVTAEKKSTCSARKEKKKKKKKKKKKGSAGAGDDEDERGGPLKTSTTTTKKKAKDDNGDESEAVVLRMDLHCDGCALKVRKAIKGAQGAGIVRTDVAAGTVTVVAGSNNGNGKAPPVADPWDLKDRIEARARLAHKPRIAFVSPANPPPRAAADAAHHQHHHHKNKDGGGGGNNKKDQTPESTVVLNIQLHCKGCTDRIKRKANNIKGVKQVTVDTSKEQVTVKGTMDAKALPDVLSAKLKRKVTAAVVVPAMTNKEKKAAAGGGNNHVHDNREGEETAISSSSSAGAKKKNKKNWKQQRGYVVGDDKDYKEMEMEMEMGWMLEEQQYPMTMIFLASYGGVAGSSSSYRVELLQGPQLFSDENPNACSLM